MSWALSLKINSPSAATIRRIAKAKAFDYNNGMKTLALILGALTVATLSWAAPTEEVIKGYQCEYVKHLDTFNDENCYGDRMDSIDAAKSAAQKSCGAKDGYKASQCFKVVAMDDHGHHNVLIGLSEQ